MGLGGIIEAVVGIGDIFVNLANLVVLIVKLFAELIPKLCRYLIRFNL